LKIKGKEYLKWFRVKQVDRETRVLWIATRSIGVTDTCIQVERRDWWNGIPNYIFNFNNFFSFLFFFPIKK